MTKLFTALPVALGLLACPGVAFAAERSVTLKVENMICPACPYTVRKTLERVSGVTKATVSLENKMAVVIYDDTKTDVSVLTQATAKAGFPSAQKN